MPLAPRLGGAILAAALGGCSTLEISTDYDTAADFSGLSTYAWMAPRETPADPRIDNTLLEKRIHRAVDAELAAKGYTKTWGETDFLVSYHAGIEGKLDVAVMNNYYGYRRGWGPSDVWVSQYDQGTLLLDVVAPETKELMWRGTASDVIDPSASAEQREENLREAVRRMLENFPPK